jgi:DNA-binding GntR family transcriptional regulator
VSQPDAGASSADDGRLTPLRRKSTAELIADQLRDAIRDGALPPGTSLGEVELAEQLGVSRGPLREAIQRLVQEGLLDAEPHRGVAVVQLSADDVRDIYFARGAVESALCRLVIAGNRELAADRLGAAQQRMGEAARQGDARALGEADLAFHETLAAAAGSPRLERVTRTLLVETRMCMSALQDTYRVPADMAREHGALVDAIRAGDEARALAIVQAHMDDAVRRLLGEAGGRKRKLLEAEPLPPVVGD